MHQAIRTSVEGKRGCGYRKLGGMYLVSKATGKPCGKLPLPLGICPCCGSGVKQARGFTWINPKRLFHGVECMHDDPPEPTPGEADDALFFKGYCKQVKCILADKKIPDRSGLIWIGGKFYKTPEAFNREADQMGVSRRIRFIPKGFKVGKDWIFLAHPKAIQITITIKNALGMMEDQIEYLPGVFSVFKPKTIEVIVSGGEEETDEYIDALVERGLSPVKVIRK